MTSSPDSSLLCPSCNGQNAPDSKFCRHCGHALDAASPVAPAGPPDSIAFGSEMEMPDDVLPAVASPAVASPEGEAGEEALSSPGEIDGRRARQLLERAHGLAERNDTAGAILACRQALALAPAVAGGQAMLGALLERTGDLTHAIQALERAVQLAPEGGAARDLARLRDKLGVQPENAPTFHFDDAELFGDESSLPTLVAAPVEVPEAISPGGSDAVSVAAGASTDAPIALPLVEAPPMGAAPESIGEESNAAIPASEGALPVVTAVPAPPQGMTGTTEPAPAIAAAIPPTRERRVADVPVRIERRAGASPSLAAPGTPIGARVKAPVVATAINPLLLADTAAKPQGIGALWTQPSYFTRSLPLVGATILSLGFLGWARGLADARNLASAPAMDRSAGSK